MMKFNNQLEKKGIAIDNKKTIGGNRLGVSPSYLRL
jgi:hypothetical protein